MTLRQRAATYRDSFLTQDPRHTFFTLSAVSEGLPSGLSHLLPFLKSFLKPTLAGQTDGAPPQTDEMLNRGESACPNDTRQKAGR